MTNRSNRVLYTGVTNNIARRVYEHKNELIEGFTKKYNASKLIYLEVFDDIENAIMREKEIKGWRRSKKTALIESKNPQWKDLGKELLISE
jgi:putative endonuclease